MLATDRHRSTLVLGDPERPSASFCRYSYRAFGARTDIGGIAPARQDPSFQNRTFDAGLGIYDYRNRSFDPATGRFLQRDPVMGGDELFNPYCFPGNNPVTGSDPMGNDWVEEDKSTGAVYWQIQRDALGCRTVRTVEIGRIAMFMGKRGVSYDGKFGEGGAWLGELQEAARNIYSEYGDISNLDESEQDRIIKSILDRVRRGQTLNRHTSAMDAFSEGFAGGLAIGLNVFAFGAYDDTVLYQRWHRTGTLNSRGDMFLGTTAAEYEAEGGAYTVSKWCFTGSREIMIGIGTAGLGAYGQSGRLAASWVRLGQKGVLAYQVGSGGYMIGHGISEVGEGLAEGDQQRVLEGQREMMCGGLRVGFALVNAKNAQDADTARAAIEARNREYLRIRELPSNQRNRVAAVAGAAKPGVLAGRGAAGVAITGVSGGECAEDAAVRALGGYDRSVRIAPAFQPRKAELLPPCDRCMGNYFKQFLPLDAPPASTPKVGG